MPVLIVQKENNIGKIVINRPKSMNALNLKVMKLLEETIDDFSRDKEVRAAILTGAGEKAFCAGLDLTEVPLSPEQKFIDYARDLGRFQRISTGLRTLEIPVIAAVNGYAVGAGCDITLACDFRIGSENAVFQEGFVNVGLVPGDGGAYLLPRIVGEAAAKEMILTGRRVKAREAMEMGLVSEVTASSQLMDAAMEKARSLASGPTIAISEAKKLINKAYSSDLKSALEHATVAQRICSQTKDHKEALTAFKEKRKPEFKGE